MQNCKSYTPIIECACIIKIVNGKYSFMQMYAMNLNYLKKVNQI